MTHPLTLHRIVFAIAAWLALSLNALAGPIEDLRAGEWYEVPNSHLEAVLPSPLPAGEPENIINAWSGGAFDTQRNRLLVWGGGHNDYCGNEVYAFDVPTLTWKRLTNPSSDPKSVHSYDGLEYLPVQDQFFAAGGSTCSPGGNATQQTWWLDLSSNSWNQKADMPGAYADFWELGMVSDYDPVSSRVIMVGNHQSGDFNPLTNTWRLHDNGMAGLDQNTTGALDPVNRKFVSIGSGTAYIFSVDATGFMGGRSNLNSTGAKDMESRIAPGLVYDPVSKKLVSWSGGQNVYTLDVATRVWTRMAATNSVDPGDPFATGQYRGTLGRWRYMPAYNAFIVVFAINKNVFVYKLSDTPGAADPTVSLSANPTSIPAQGTSTLTWSTSNADACVASNGWTGTKALSGSQAVGPLSANTTFVLTCTNTGGGSTVKSTTVTIQQATPKPTVTFSANPSNVAMGGSSTLTWSSSNATSCTGSGGLSGWAGSKPTSGSANVGPFSAQTTFTLSCTGSGGTTQKSATVSLSNAPTMTLSASPRNVQPGNTTTLTWSSTNTTGCTASGAWAGNKATSGSEQSGPLQNNSTFTLTCTGAGGSTNASANVTVSMTPPPPGTPTVAITSDHSTVAINGTALLTWSSTDADSCMASGGWSGSKATSGSETVGPLAITTTYTLECTGSAGTGGNSVTVTVTSGAGDPPTQDSSGGGALDLRTLAALAGILVFAVFRRRGLPVLRWTAAAVVATGLLPQPSFAVTPDEDWLARSTAPGVVKAVGFDTQAEYQNGLWNQGRNNAWDPNVKASGAGAIRFDVLSNTGEGAGGSWTTNFSDDLSVQFGANEEFWVQWRQRFDAYVIDHQYQHLSGSGEWKQVDITQGDMPGVIANSCTENEMVMQNVSDRDYSSMYLECGNYSGLETYLGNSQFTRQNQRRNSSGVATCLWVIPGDTSGCLKYFPDEWMTFMVHVKLGPEGVARSSVGDASDRHGFINSTVEFYVGRAGQPLVLAHSQDGIVIPRGEHWDASKGVNPDDPNDPGYSGGWGPSDGHPLARYGKIWLTTYNTQKDPAETHQNASIWYDELIISRQRIPDPMSAGGSPNQTTVSLSANPATVQSGANSTLTWSSTNATTCAATGTWSGTKATSGSQSVGPLNATSTYTLTCSNASGGTATRSVTVTVQSGSPSAPTVNFSANPTSVDVGGFSTLQWTTSGATSCSGSNGLAGWAGSKPTTGSANVGPLNVATTFMLSCTGSGGTTQKSVNVSITGMPVITFTADPATVQSGSHSMLTWSASDASGCMATGAWSGNKATSGNEQTATLTQSSTYGLECTGAGGTATKSVTVSVTSGSGDPGGSSSGGGSLEWLSLVSLLAGLRYRRRMMQLQRAGA